VSEQFLNGTSAHIRLFSAIHSFSAVHGMVDSHKRWIESRLSVLGLELKLSVAGSSTKMR